MPKKIKVLFAASECKPMIPTGGVAVVAKELPPALKSLGVDITRILPKYGKIEPRYVGKKIFDFSIPFEGKNEPVEVYEGERFDAVRNILVKCPPNYFEGDHPSSYIPGNAAADIKRYAFFSKALATVIGSEQPDIVHLNDWPMGLVPAFMHYVHLPQKVVTTVHNAGYGYQGSADKHLFGGSEVERVINDPRLGRWLEMGNSVNLLKLAMEMSCLTNTVSPQYAWEMTQPGDWSRYLVGGCGLEQVASRLSDEGRFFGILNGTEYKEPADESHFLNIMGKKAEYKASLAGYFENPYNMLWCFIGRAAEQKFKFLAEHIDGKTVIEHLLDIPDINLAVVATGDPPYEDLLRWLASQGRKNFLAVIKFDLEMAHRINMGAELALVPSLFEPCGIVQLEAKDRCTVPFVSVRGGLKQTVKPHTQANGTGFVFDGNTGEEILRNIISLGHEARNMYFNNRAEYFELQRRAYLDRYGWHGPAEQYITRMYEPLVRKFKKAVNA